MDKSPIDAGLRAVWAIFQPELREETRRRTKVIRNLPESVCPTTRSPRSWLRARTSGSRRSWSGVDECQVWFEHPEHGEELEEICTDLVSAAPPWGSR